MKEKYKIVFVKIVVKKKFQKRNPESGIPKEKFWIFFDKMLSIQQVTIFAPKQKKKVKQKEVK